MRAFRILRPGVTDVVEAPRPTAGPGQIVLRVLANGLCHSDLFIRNLPASLPGTTYPVTMGHEIAGEVVEIGPGVTDWQIGERAVSYVLRGCGTCRPCGREQDNLCRRGYRGIGTHFDGGLAEYVVSEARYLVRIHDLDPVTAAPLADAGMTAYHAIDRARHVLTEGSTALVIGIGGLGHMAVQILRAVTPATIIAVDKDPQRLEHARELGADHAVLAGDTAEEEIREIVDVEGVTATIDFVGVDQSLTLGARITGGGGVVVVPGQGNGTIPFTASIQPVLRREVAIMQTQAGSLQDLREVITLARREVLAPTVQTFDLEDTNRALRDLDEGRILGRAVVVP